MTTDDHDLLDTWAGAERTVDASTLDDILTDDFVGIGPGLQYSFIGPPLGAPR